MSQNGPCIGYGFTMYGSVNWFPSSLVDVSNSIVNWMSISHSGILVIPLKCSSPCACSEGPPQQERASLVFAAVVSLPPALPEGVIDFDEESRNDPFAESTYAADIFNYYKEREVSCGSPFSVCPVSLLHWSSEWLWCGPLRCLWQCTATPC